MNKIKLGIIGAGNITVKYLETINNIKQFQVEAISSRTFKKALKISKKFNIKKTYTDNLNLIYNHSLDAIIIAVSYDQIFKVTLSLLKFKKPLLIEKPPGLSMPNLNKLIKLSEKYKTLNMIALNRRFYSIFHKAIKDIEKNNDQVLNVVIEGHERFWKVENKINKNVAKRWLHANSIHTIDLIRFFGGEIKKIKINKKSIKKNYDQFYLLFEFKNKNHGIYYANWYSPGGWEVKLYTEKKTYHFKPLESGIVINRKFQIKKILPSKYDLNLKEGFYQQLIFFKNLIINKKLQWPAQSFKDIKNTYKIIELMYKKI